MAHLIILLAVFLYSAAWLSQGLVLMGATPRSYPVKMGLCLLGIPAVLLHAYLLHTWVDLVAGQNLSAVNLLSLVAWLSSLLIIVFTTFKPIANLSVMIFPLAVFSIMLATLFPGHDIINTAIHLKTLVHILLSIVTLSVLCVAGLQAIMLWIAHRQLHRHGSVVWLQRIAPLQTLETILFQWVNVGFVLLTIVFVTSLVFFVDVHWDVFMWQKIVCTIAAWITFALLLIGRYGFGWRGRKAVSFTLFGLLFVLIAYFGSELSLEMML